MRLEELDEVLIAPTDEPAPEGAEIPERDFEKIMEGLTDE